MVAVAAKMLWNKGRQLPASANSLGPDIPAKCENKDFK